jgi:hypothetical protein
LVTSFICFSIFSGGNSTSAPSGATSGLANQHGSLGTPGSNGTQKSSGDETGGAYGADTGASDSGNANSSPSDSGTPSNDDSANAGGSAPDDGTTPGSDSYKMTPESVGVSSRVPPPPKDIPAATGFHPPDY